MGAGQVDLSCQLIEEGADVAYDWWLTPAVYSGLSVVLLEARLRRAASRGKKLIFSGSLLFKLLLGGGALGLSALLFQQGAQSELFE
jgi:hypothetical protein